MPYNINIERIRRDQSVYTLTNNDIWRKYSIWMHDKINLLKYEDRQEIRKGKMAKEDYEKKWNDPKSILKIHKECSLSLHIPLLYECETPLWQFIFEVLHFKLRFGVRAVSMLVQLMWCVFCWTLIEIKLVIMEFGML